MKIKESEIIDEYLDIVKKLKTVEHMVDGDTSETVPKGLEKDWRNGNKDGRLCLSSQPYFLDQPEYEEESRKLDETCCHSDYSECPPVNLLWKTRKEKNNYNNNNNNNNNNGYFKRET